MTKTLILLSAMTVLSMAQEQKTIPSDGSDLKITIYNKSMAFVNDKRSIDIKEGRQKLVYQGVPGKVISESVIPLFEGVKVDIFSQNYMFNLVSQSAMIKYSIDKEVEYYKNNAVNLESPELFAGTLISGSPSMIKDDKSGKIITVGNPNQIVFSRIPKGMITKPSLVWNVKVASRGVLNIDLKYLTTGISWKSDYVLNLKGKTLDLNGWITIYNNSGITYSDASITCLAGDVNKAPRAAMEMENTVLTKSRGMSMDSVKEEAFSGYHIYKIPFRETIENKQKKQIVFIEKKSIPYMQYGYGVNNYFENYGEQKMVFKNIIEFKNREENNLGIPLPAGIVRMYKKDKRGETHFVGEDRVGNIPNKEVVKLTIGKMFDVVGNKTITKFKSDKYSREVETTYEVRNRGEETVKVVISENIPTYGRNISVKSSCVGRCREIKKSAFRREFVIELEEGEVYSFKSEFKISFH